MCVEVLGPCGCRINPSCIAGQSVSVVACLALFVIGIYAMQGTMPLSTASWMTLGFSGALGVGLLGNGQFKQRKCQLILGGLGVLTTLVLGSLGVAGVLTTAMALGIGVFVTALLFSAMVPSGAGCDAFIHRVRNWD
ncbi:MAG: hypothetical protein S4CHLAM2_12130 [Chlamydiales bacterium]|nr:hypothetical protein [Chlamydiales bacterium]